MRLGLIVRVGRAAHQECLDKAKTELETIEKSHKNADHTGKMYPYSQLPKLQHHHINQTTTASQAVNQWLGFLLSIC